MRMIIKLMHGLVAVAFLLPLMSFAAGQNNYVAQQQGFASPQLIRDPFTPSDLMFKEINKRSNGYYSGSVSAIANVPQMRLGGFITEGKDKSPLALLEVSGSRTFLVREGDEINIDPTQPQNVIRITKINRQSVTVETRTLGAIRVQR